MAAVFLSFATEARAAERALWVWGMTKDIVLNPLAKQDFFTFCSAPQGDAAKAVTVIFFDAKPWGYNLMATNPIELRQFLADAHLRGIKVEFLSGDKSWATPEKRTIGENLIDEITSFNLGGGATQRFDGIQYDVEPYLLNTKIKDDPYDWDYDRGLVWNEYLTLLTNCQAKVNAYNAANTPTIRFGVAVPFWYVLGQTPGPEQVIDSVDYVAVMAYRDIAANITNVAQDEVMYAASKGKKVYVAVEVSHPTDTADFPPSTTFYEEGNSTMEIELGQVNNSFSSYTSYVGIAIHYYEDLTGPRGYEASYRSLWTASRPYKGHHPVVTVLSPNRPGEVWAGAVNVQWRASDLDDNSISIKIEYSSNGGASWTTLVSNIGNSGNYLWDTGALSAGSNYLIRITGTDNSVNSLSGYDVSDNTLTISSAVTKTDITDLHIWNEGTASLRLKWTPPNYTPRSYKIYRSINDGPFGEIVGSPVVAVNKYIDAGLSGANKYKYQIRAIYGDGLEGNPSNISNMLIPGTSFLMDYCEQNEGINYAGPYGTSTLTYVFDTADKMEGAKSLRLDYTYAGSGWGSALVGNFPVRVDVSPYNAIKFWAKRNGGTGTAFALKLIETGRPEGDEEWRSPNIVLSSTNWTEYKFNLSDLILDSAAGNNRLDLHAIGSYVLLFSSQAINGVYFIDEVRLATEGASISVPQSEYSFGALVGAPADHRFVLGPIPITFGGFNPPWTVRMWTNNGTGAVQSGLKGADGVNYIPLKVWCVNFGPTIQVPNEEDDNLWRDYWLRVPEDDEMDSVNRYTWRRLAWSPGAELSSPFDIYLAIDVLDAAVIQQYQTTTLTLEYINE